MLNKEIYQGALRLLAEPFDEDRTADYAERAPYIIANFISETAATDGHYRAFNGLPEAKVNCGVYASLDSKFPLSDRFAPAAQFYLASMLIDDEDGDRADNFFDRYCKSLADILAQIPAMREKIVNFYDSDK